jgi:hypothetical protein
VLNHIKFNVADRRETVGDLFKDFAGNSARLAKLGRELKKCDLRWMIVIQVQVLG